MSDPVARRLTVQGRVQGVFFRGSVQRRARTLGVAGWARNEPDGSVAVFAEGAPEAVEALVEFCRSGPRGAEVERVDVEEVEPHGLASFEVC